MAVDMFLKIEGIEGESTDKFHKGEIDVLSYSWGVSNHGTSSGGGGGGAGRAVAEDFSFTHLVDKASPNLMLACARGSHFSNATLSVRKGGGGGGDYLKYKLTDCIISSVSPSFVKERGDDAPLEGFEINFAKIEETFTTSSGEVVSTSFDFQKNA